MPITSHLSFNFPYEGEHGGKSSRFVQTLMNILPIGGVCNVSHKPDEIKGLVTMFRTTSLQCG